MHGGAMNDTLIRYLRAAEAIAALAIVCGLVYGAHAYIQSERKEERLLVVGEYEKKLQEQKELAAQERTRMQAQINAATTGEKERENTIRSLAASNSAVSASLRDTTKSISSSLSGLSGDALRSLASSYGDVLGSCQAGKDGLAEEAERLNSEKRTLIESWPTERK